MKKIGIVGGVSWQSTIAYYADICKRGQHLPQLPEVSIESLDLKKAEALFGTDGNEDSWEQFDAYYRSALNRLAVSGAEIAFIASNTPHHRIASIIRGVDIPVVSILDAVAKKCVRIGLPRLLLLGTALTMRSEVIRDGYAAHGVDAVGPSDSELRSQTVALINDLQNDRLDGTRERLLWIVGNAIDPFDSKPAVCLGCTELPLAFGSAGALETFTLNGVTFVNTSIVHANAVFDFAAGDEAASLPMTLDAY